MRLVAALLAFGLAASPLVAHAAAAQCIAAHAEGQVQRKAGKLLAAHEQFAACAVDTCPALIRKDCLAFQAELQTAQPSVTVEAKDEQGRPVPEARVSIDDRPATAAGSRVALDPGEHALTVSEPGGRSDTQRFLLHEGEQSSLVMTVPGALEGDRTKPASRGIPTATYVLGGTALAALGSFTYFGLRGRAKQGDLDACSETRSCSAPDVHEMRQLYLAADISLGISLLSLGLGSYFFLTRPAPASEQSAAEQRLRLGVVALPGAYLLNAGGRF